MNRIAIDCRYVRERPSGIATYLLALIEWLPTLAPDIEWLFLRHPRAPELSRARNVREVIVPFEPGGPVTMWALPSVVDLRDVTLFHATFNLAPARLPCPVVTTVHDLMWREQPTWCRRALPWGWVETAFWQHGIERAVRRSERLLTVSRASADRIAALYPRAAERTRVTPLFASSDFRPPRTADDHERIVSARNKHAPGAKRYVLSVGQSAGYKNHDGALRGFARAFAEDHDTHMVFVQRIGTASALRRLSRALGVEERVHFASGVAFEELRALIWGALCLCHPSHVEGFGLPVVEAMAAGCPVLTSNVSALPEVTGGAALHVDPRDDEQIAAGLRKLATDRNLRTRLRLEGQRRAAELSPRRTALATLEAYREILAPASSRESACAAE